MLVEQVEQVEHMVEEVERMVEEVERMVEEVERMVEEVERMVAHQGLQVFFTSSINKSRALQKKIFQVWLMLLIRNVSQLRWRERKQFFEFKTEHQRRAW